MMDVSDGLLLDAYRMAEASEVSIAIDSAAVPVADPDRPHGVHDMGRRLRAAVHLAGRHLFRPFRRTRIGSVEPRGFAAAVSGWRSRSPIRRVWDISTNSLATIPAILGKGKSRA